MNIPSSQLKLQARQAMRNARPGVLRMSLAHLFMTTGIRFLVSLLFLDPIGLLVQLLSEGLDIPRALTVTLSQTGKLGLFCYILALILIVVLDFSYQLWCLGSSRGGIGEWSDLFGCFFMAGRAVTLRLIVLLYGIILYACAILLASLLTVVVMFTSLFGLLAVIPIFIAAMVFVCWRMLHYSMAAYCLMDAPQEGAAFAIEKSRALMRGNCWNYLRLMLSFLGWQLLLIFAQLLVEGLLLLVLAGPALFAGNYFHVAELAGALTALLCSPLQAWLTCYCTMSTCRFYDSLLNSETQK